MTTYRHRLAMAIALAVLLVLALSTTVVASAAAAPAFQVHRAPTRRLVIVPPGDIGGRGGVAVSGAQAVAGGAAAAGPVKSSSASGAASGASRGLPAASRTVLVGRGGVRTAIATTGSAAAGWIAGGAIGLALVVGAAVLWALSRRDRRAAAADENDAAEVASVTSISRGRTADAASPAEQSERKAA